jgi:transposase
MNNNKIPLQFGDKYPIENEDAIEINGSLWFTDNDGYRVVYQGWGTPLYRISLDDEVEVRFVAVSLRLGGFARQYEIAGAFGHSVESQRRWEHQYQDTGINGLHNKKSPGPEFKITNTQEHCIRKWFKEGLSNVEMARRLEVTETTIRRTLKRLGLQIKKSVPSQPTLPLESSDRKHKTVKSDEESGKHEQNNANDIVVDENDSEIINTGSPEIKEDITVDPTDRSLDRLLAALGRLDDAVPIFGDADQLPRAGVFLAVPLLVRSGILEVFQRVYHTLGPAFYGLRTTMVCLFFLALLRIKRPENLKEYSPEELGRLLGLDRAPEVKTLRRKLDQLANRQEGKNLMRELAEQRAKERPEILGVLYFDGHVKEYSGKEATGKAFVCRRRLAAPAATDTWVNDINGDPLFVVHSDINEGLTKTLEPILAQVRSFTGPEKEITVVFDRGGWSPKLFTRLINSGFHIITYRKGHFNKIPCSHFQKRTLVEGEKKYTYELHDAPRIRIGKTGNKKGEGTEYLWLRQVVRLREDNRQTAVITDRQDLAPEKVLYTMFNRWRQENFFKYMREEFALDALLEYGSEPMSQELDHPNPALKEIDKKLRKAREEKNEAERILGELLGANKESERPTVRGFKIANAEATRKVEDTKELIEQLRAKKKSLPKRVPADDLVILKRERNLVADAIKMSAYQIESELCSMGESYARNEEEGRTLLHAAFQSSAKIEVIENEIQITMASQSSPHRSQAVADLCQELNKIEACFPGTKKRIVLAVNLPEPVTF